MVLTVINYFASKVIPRAATRAKTLNIVYSPESVIKSRNECWFLYPEYWLYWLNVHINLGINIDVITGNLTSMACFWPKLTNIEKLSTWKTSSVMKITAKLLKFQKCPFRRACLNGELQTMKDIYEKNSDIEMNVDRSGTFSAKLTNFSPLCLGWNGLHHAAAAGQLKPIEIMLYWKFDVNAVTNDNETPILLSTRNGHKVR